MNKKTVLDSRFSERMKGYEKDILPCHDCGIEKPKEEFPILKHGNREWYSFVCRDCASKKKKDIVKLNRKFCAGCVHNSELRSKCKIGLEPQKECPEYDEILYNGGFVNV